MKICSKTHQIAPFKNFFGEACPRTPIANAWLCQASQAPPPQKKKIVAKCAGKCRSNLRLGKGPPGTGKTLYSLMFCMS